MADEHNGLLVSAGDANALTVTLSRLLHNDALQQQLAAAARRTVEERYSFDVRMRKVVAVYDEVNGGGKLQSGHGRHGHGDASRLE